MTLEPPVPVALARPVADLPREALASGRLQADAKVDGWRGVLFTARGLLHTRAGNFVQRRFPEVMAAGAALGDLVLDGEIVALRSGKPAFAELQSSPESRAARGVRITFVAFDLLAVGDQDWRRRPLRERRAGLEDRVASGPYRVQPVAVTRDPDLAQQWWLNQQDLVEGLVLKPLGAAYRPGHASGWTKLRRTTTVELVVLGVTGRGAGTALVLGAPGRGGRLRPVAVSLPLPAGAQQELAVLLRAHGSLEEVSGTVGGLPGAAPIRYQPVEPVVVVEVVSDLVTEWGRLRHRPRWLRVRGDLDPSRVGPLL